MRDVSLRSVEGPHHVSVQVARRARPGRSACAWSTRTFLSQASEPASSSCRPRVRAARVGCRLLSERAPCRVRMCSMARSPSANSTGAWTSWGSRGRSPSSASSEDAQSVATGSMLSRQLTGREPSPKGTDRGSEHLLALHYARLSQRHRQACPHPRSGATAPPSRTLTKGGYVPGITPGAGGGGFTPFESPFSFRASGSVRRRSAMSPGQPPVAATGCVQLGAGIRQPLRPGVVEASGSRLLSAFAAFPSCGVGRRDYPGTNSRPTRANRAGGRGVRRAPTLRRCSMNLPSLGPSADG